MPVITSTASAFPEIVREGETGVRVEPGSVDELCSALVRVSEEPFLIKSMSRNCLGEAQKYTTEKFVDNYLDIYEPQLG